MIAGSRGSIVPGLVVLALGVLAAIAADPPGTPASREALALCERVDTVPEKDQSAMLERALALAERAVAADEQDALAHFAVFCSLGRRMRRAGIALGALVDLRRLRTEINRTLELAPDFADALAGKGALLLDSPRLLGGDPAGAERLLRRALDVDPNYLSPRFNLIRALRRRGAQDEARREAERALEIATRKNDPEDVAQARALLSEAEPP